MGMLELLINFLVSLSSSSLVESTLISTYILENLKINPLNWENCSTKTINQNVQLCHLQSLYLSLEEQMKGSSLDGVLMCYRTPLSDDLSAHLRSISHALDLPVLIPIIRDFLTNQLTVDVCKPADNLKTFLTYTSSGEDLVDFEWYNEFFPSSLSVQHTYHLYYFLYPLVK
jgi:hypothetical protein